MQTCPAPCCAVPLWPSCLRCLTNTQIYTQKEKEVSVSVCARCSVSVYTHRHRATSELSKKTNSCTVMVCYKHTQWQQHDRLFLIPHWICWIFSVFVFSCYCRMKDLSDWLSLTKKKEKKLPEAISHFVPKKPIITKFLRCLLTNNSQPAVIINALVNESIAAFLATCNPI